MAILNIVSTAAAALMCVLAAFARPTGGGARAKPFGSRRLGLLADKYHYALLLLIALFAVFTRFYKLGEIPAGVNIDEAGAAYDAWCISNYGVD